VFARFYSLLRALIWRHTFETGMSEELRFHIEHYADELVRAGIPPEEARRRARMEFGNLNSVEGECREARGLSLFDELRRELSFAARLLRKTPGFTATALITVAICLGSNLTIFAVIDSVLLRPLPFPEAGRLVTVFNTYPKAGVDRDGSSLTNYYERRGQIPAFSSLSMYAFGTAIVGETGSTERQQITRVSPEFFTTLGTGPAFGRTFTEAETNSQNDTVAILSNDYWRKHFHADANVIGRQIRVDTFPKTVIGVLPDGFHFLSSDSGVYLPLASRPEDRAPAQRHSGGNVKQMIARLKPGATLAQAQSQIDAQNARLEADDPEGKAMADAGFRSLVVSLHADHVAAIRPTLLLLQTAVLVLLLIGTVNLANLLLIRANGRAKEVAVRQALGASSAYVVSELIVETTSLTLFGGLLGMVAGAGGIRVLAALGVSRLPLGAHITFNARLALMAAAAAFLMGIVLAIPIAWLHLRRSGNALGSENRSVTSGRAAQAVRQSFVVAQVALAFVLLVGAGLLGISLERVMAVSPGFQSDHVLTAEISLIGAKYPAPPAGLKFAERFRDELSHQPGVLFAGVVNNVPFTGNSGKSAASVKGHVLRPGESPRGHYSYGVGGDYFRAMGFSLRAGRFLTGEDSRRKRRVCVIDEDFARYYWPNTSPLGHLLFQGSSAGPVSKAFTVVGVVGSTKQAGLADESAQGAVYYPYIYRPDSNIYVAVRASLPPESIRLKLHTIVRQIDPELVVDDIRSMDDRIADSLVARRSPALLAGLFSIIALLLTGIGTYGVLSYAVAQRKREIGVRMALGARPVQIRSEFLALTLRLFAAGTVVGSLGAWLTGKAMQAVLFHVPAISMALFGSALAIMALVSLFACLLPADRAARISPMQALADQ
jgi:predicted permease